VINGSGFGRSGPIKKTPPLRSGRTCLCYYVWVKKRIIMFRKYMPCPHLGRPGDQALFPTQSFFIHTGAPQVTSLSSQKTGVVHFQGQTISTPYSVINTTSDDAHDDFCRSARPAQTPMLFSHESGHAHQNACIRLRNCSYGNGRLHSPPPSWYVACSIIHVGRPDPCTDTCNSIIF